MPQQEVMSLVLQPKSQIDRLMADHLSAPHYDKSIAVSSTAGLAHQMC